jgi:hypothetical protein
VNQKEDSMNQDRPSMPDLPAGDRQYAFRCTWPVRLALNTLEGELPGHEPGLMVRLG